MACPGFVIDITPAKAQKHFEELFSAGMFAINTVGFPGAHGVVVAGIQGIGVKTPIAAEVAAATVGFAIEVHTPKGRIFTMGLWSMIFAAGIGPVITLFIGKTIKLDGAAPKEHCIIAPIHTCCPIIL